MPSTFINFICPKCGGKAGTTVYIVPGSLGTIYEYGQGHCVNCGETIPSEQVQAMSGHGNKTPIDLYAQGNTAKDFWEVQKRTYPPNFIRRLFRWRKS